MWHSPIPGKSYLEEKWGQFSLKQTLIWESIPSPVFERRATAAAYLQVAARKSQMAINADWSNRCYSGITSRQAKTNDFQINTRWQDSEENRPSVTHYRPLHTNDLKNLQFLVSNVAHYSLCLCECVCCLCIPYALNLTVVYCCHCLFNMPVKMSEICSVIVLAFAVTNKPLHSLMQHFFFQI